jgi:hypothetical protein
MESTNSFCERLQAFKALLLEAFPQHEMILGRIMVRATVTEPVLYLAQQSGITTENNDVIFDLDEDMDFDKCTAQIKKLIDEVDKYAQGTPLP